MLYSGYQAFSDLMFPGRWLASTATALGDVYPEGWPGNGLIDRCLALARSSQGRK